MNTGVISVRYAKALLEYAKTQGVEDKVYAAMKTLAERFARIPDLRRSVENPVLDTATKISLLQEAVQTADAGGEMMRFFRLVLDKKREKYLQFMILSYIDLYRESKNILIGHLTTAVPSPSLLSSLKEKAEKQTNGTVELETTVNPDIIGGYIIELGGYRVDASIASQLKQVEQQFLTRNRRIV